MIETLLEFSIVLNILLGFSLYTHVKMNNELSNIIRKYSKQMGLR